MLRCVCSVVCSGQWLLGCIVYSLSVSVKMNTLLFAPPLIILLLRNVGVRSTVGHLAVCAAVQVCAPRQTCSPLAVSTTDRCTQLWNSCYRIEPAHSSFRQRNDDSYDGHRAIFALTFDLVWAAAPPLFGDVRWH